MIQFLNPTDLSIALLLLNYSFKYEELFLLKATHDKVEGFAELVPSTGLINDAIMYCIFADPDKPSYKSILKRYFFCALKYSEMFL